MIPPKIITTGDYTVSAASIGFGKKELGRLKHDMNFQNINEAYRDLNPFPGVFVRVASSFSIEYIHIHSGNPVSVEEDKVLEKQELDEEKKDLVCPCFPCFSFGIIQTIRTTPTDQEYRDGARYAYDILVCSGDSYLFFANLEVMSTGWEEYYPGQFVLITIDVLDREDNMPLCCSDSACLLADPFNTDKLVPACFTISPLFINGAMQQWIEL